MKETEEPIHSCVSSTGRTLSFIHDDGGYEAAEVLEADQPSVVRAIAICLRPNEEYRIIHHRYVHTLAVAGFTPTGKIRASVERNADIRLYPAAEKHAKAQVCEELLESYGFLRQMLPDKKATLGEAHQQFGDCIALLRDRRGRDAFVALVGGALRDPMDLRTYRWAREAARGSHGKRVYEGWETRDRRALQVWRKSVDKGEWGDSTERTDSGECSRGVLDVDTRRGPGLGGASPPLTGDPCPARGGRSHHVGPITRNDLECFVRILWIRGIKNTPAETSAGVFPVAGFNRVDPRMVGSLASLRNWYPTRFRREVPTCSLLLSPPPLCLRR